MVAKRKPKRMFADQSGSRAYRARARRAARVVVAPFSMEGHCTGETSLYFGARPWCDVPAAASEAQPASTWHAYSAPLRSLSIGRRRSTHACDARAMVMIGLRPLQGHCTGETSLSIGAKP